MTTTPGTYWCGVVIAFLIALSFGDVIAQEKMSKDQWQNEMAASTTKRTELKAQETRLTADIAVLRADSDRLEADIRVCEDALYAILGVTRPDLDAFDQELTEVESRLAELQKMSDADLLNYRDEIERMKTRLGEMSKSMIAMIPRYGQRMQSLQDKVAGLLKSVSREKSYTVGTWARNRDCLWNIARKNSIYANPWMWPKIWQANRDNIRDPDVIKPKWALKIPEGKELSKAEKSAANSYYRKRASTLEGY